jgi:hypothetical protein
MSEEAQDALYVGVGVAATCIGVMCSMYHCCCRVWRRLKAHTPAVTAGAVVAAGAVAASQLTGVATSGPPANRGSQAPSGATCSGTNSSGAAADCTASPDSGCGDRSGHTSTPHTVRSRFRDVSGGWCLRIGINTTLE